MKNDHSLKNGLLTVLFGIAVFLFIISFSIAIPFYCRFFYYAQIGPLGLEEATGYDYATIKAAYDEVLNYLTLPGQPFGTGVFAHTAEGAAHFYDCKILFNLDAIILAVTAAVIITLLILNKKRIITLVKPFGLSAGFYSAVGIFVFFSVLIGLVAIDFDQAFVIFHRIFFPGKDNWTFNSNYDQIIKILPQEFFMNCAILIGTSIILISLTLIIIAVIKKKKATRFTNAPTE